MRVSASEILFGRAVASTISRALSVAHGMCATRLIIGRGSPATTQRRPPGRAPLPEETRAARAYVRRCRSRQETPQAATSKFHGSKGEDELHDSGRHFRYDGPPI